MFRASHWIIMLAAITLAGCSSKFEPVSLQRDLTDADVRIGLLPVNYLNKPEVRVISNPVKYASTLAAAAIVKGDATKKRKFNEALDEQGYEYREQVEALLLPALSDHGLTVAPFPFRRSIDNILEAVPPRRFEKRYPSSTDVDLLLDIYIDFVGYAAPTVTADYLPTFHLAARLVDASNHEVVYQARIRYHEPREPDPADILLPADEHYTFANFDALMADTELAQVGLEAAIAAVIERLADELSRG